MKKLLYLLTGILLAAFILPSCSSTLSITKRRYNKGFYVHQIRNKHNASPAVHAARSHQAELARGEESEAFRAVEHIVKKDEEKQERGEALTARAFKKNLRQFKADYGAAPVELAVRNPVKTLKAAQLLTAEAAAQDEALSLLWILIVVILIVYILGLLMDGFGLGELIHILGVVILVLLILWLLRLL